MKNLNRHWLGLAICVVAVVVISIPIIAHEKRVSRRRAKEKGRAEAQLILSQDSLEANRDWVLQHMRFPDAWQDRLESIHDEQEFEAVLEQYIAQRSVVAPIDSLMNNNDNTVANYHNGVLQLGVNDPIPFVQPFNWAQTDQGENFLMELHSLRLLTNFIDEFQERGDRQYIDLAAAILLDWIQKNPYPKPKYFRAWHEGSVSKRIVVLSNFAMKYPTLQPSLSIKLVSLLHLIHKHATYLSQPDTYIPNGNHGMTQDQGLLAAAKAFPEFKDARQWQEIAIDRLRRLQIATGFSKEGVWKEHSPGYHYFVMRSLARIQPLLPPWEKTNFLATQQAKSDAYLAHVLTPMGLLPPVADSSEIRIGLETTSSPELTFAARRGQQGSPPSDLDGFYPDAGEVIFRDTWGNADRPTDQATYVHIHASFHERFNHAHHDDLSFIMQSFGRWWILETGKFTYDQGEWRTFVESAQAHNSVTFNGAALPVVDQGHPNRTVRIENDFVSTPQLAAARAYTNQFEPDGVEVTRTYVFLRSQNALLFLDQMKSPQAGKWQSYINLAPDIDATLDNTTVHASAPTHPDLRLHILVDQDQTLSATIIKGQRDPLLGWYSPAYRKIVPAPVIVYRRQGSEILAATLIQLADSGLPPPRDLHSEIQGKQATINWRQGDRVFVVDVSLDKKLLISFNEQ